MRYLSLIVSISMALACGGPDESAPLPPTVYTPYVVPDVMVYTVWNTEHLSGIDCSDTPCPQYGNLQCIPVGARKECQFVMRPQDTCQALVADHLSDGTAIPAVCVPECTYISEHYSFWCPNGLECVDKVGLGTKEAHGTCLH